MENKFSIQAYFNLSIYHNVSGVHNTEKILLTEEFCIPLLLTLNAMFMVQNSEEKKNEFGA